MQADSETAMAVAEKTCTKCGLTKPVADFRVPDKNGVRHPHCNACLAAYHRNYRAGNRKQKLQDWVQEMATDPANPRNVGARTRTEAVLRAMLSRFGGLDQFSRDWFEFLRLAHMAGKHHVVLRSFEALLRLMETVDATEQAVRAPLESLSDEQLRDRLDQSVIELIWAKPQIGVVVLEELGWKLEPPSEVVSRDAMPALVERVMQRLPGLFAPTAYEPLPVSALATCEEEEDL